MRRDVWVMLAAYCVLASVAGLLAPNDLKVRGVVFGLVGVGAAVINGRRRWGTSRELAMVAVGAALVVAVPEVLAGLALEHLANFWWTAVQALVPAMVVLVVAQGDAGESAWGSMAPAVAGLGGFLLLVPVSLPRNGAALLSFGVLLGSAVLIALTSVSIYPVLRRLELAQAVAIFCLTNAAVLVGAGILEDGIGWSLDGASWATVEVEAAGVVLLVVLLRMMEPVRFAARFLAIPLLAVVEGLVWLRPGLTWRTAAGLGLMAGAVAMLLWPRRAQEVPTLSLR